MRVESVFAAGLVKTTAEQTPGRNGSLIHEPAPPRYGAWRPDVIANEV